MIANLSRHASERARQRGATQAQINAVVRYADQCIRRSGNVELIWISADALAYLGPRTPEGVDVDRLGTLCLLLANDETVVTLYRVARRPQSLH